MRVVVLEHPHWEVCDAFFLRVLDEVRQGALSPAGSRTLASRCVHAADDTCSHAGTYASV